jgi:hypothetical protein
MLKLFIQPFLLFLQFSIRFLQGLVPREDVIKLLKLIRVLLLHFLQEGLKLLHVLDLSLNLFRFLEEVRGLFGPF